MWVPVLCSLMRCVCSEAHTELAEAWFVAIQLPPEHVGKLQDQLYKSLSPRYKVARGSCTA